jgi:L-rhamnose mutarotase
MARIAFRLRVRAERIADYEEAHRKVWPELLQLLKDVGITQYSIFRSGTDLFFYMHVDDFERAWSQIDANPVNRRWRAVSDDARSLLPRIGTRNAASSF